MRRLKKLAGLLIAAIVLSLFAPVVADAQTGTVGHQSHRHFGRSDGVGGPPTCCKAESKLWFHDGTWWATMIHRDSSTHRIHRLVGETWVDTGVVVDTHIARADVLHQGNTIWITGRNTSKLVRFTYSAGSSPGLGTWSRDSGFPVNLPVGSTPGLTIARDSTGTLWIAWLDGRIVRTSHSTNGGTSWSTPAALPFPQATNPRADDYAAITAFTDRTGPAVGVMWSNQVTDAQYFAIHRDGTPVTSWSMETALSGTREADDHINFATFEDRVYATVKTEQGQAGQDLIKLLTRSPSGSWSQTPVAKVEANDTRPIGVIDIDPAARRIYVFTRRKEADGTTRIVYRSSPLAGLGFPVNGTTIIQADQDVNDVTSMKANATAQSGIVVMAQTSNFYWWNRLGGGGSAPPGDPQVTLSVSTVGQGTVSRNPTGNTHPLGTEVVLTATPASGWYFAGWSGAASGNDPQTTVVMDGDRSVTATFAQDTGQPPPAGQVEFLNVSTGVATSSNSVQTATNVSAGPSSVYLAAVATRSSVVPTAVTGLGLTWTNVATQCGGRGQATVSLWAAGGSPSASAPVRATLSGSAQAATIAVSRYAGGDVSNPVTAGVGTNSLGPDGACKGGTDGTSHSIAVPHASGSGLVVAATTMRNRTHAPTSPATERAEVSAGSGGNVTSIAVLDRAVGQSSPTTIGGTYSGVTDWATVATTIRAAGSGGSGGGGGGTTQYTLTTTVNGSGTVAANPPGGTYDAGTVVQLTATPTAGWTFSGWSGNASGTSPTTSVTMSANRSVTATFTQDGGGGGGPTGDVTHQATSTGTSESATTVTSATVTAASGAAYVAAVGHRGGSATVTNVSGLGLQWSAVTAQCTGRNASRVSLWVATGSPNANGTVTATFSTGVAAATIAVGRYSGVNTSSPVVGHAAANSNGTDGACSGGTDGTSYAVPVPTGSGSGLVVGAATMRNQSHAPGSGSTERVELAAGSGGDVASVALVDRAPGSTATTPLSGTFSRDTDWGVAALTLRGAS